MQHVGLQYAVLKRTAKLTWVVQGEHLLQGTQNKVI